MSQSLLHIRRTAMLAILLLAYGFYVLVGNSYGLASIGLLSFVAISQFAPAFFGGLFWKRATARGAVAGILAGFFHLGLQPAFAVFRDVRSHRRHHLYPRPLGPDDAPAADPVLYEFRSPDPRRGLSLLANVLAFIGVSILRPPVPIERLQANVFIEETGPRYASLSFRQPRASIGIGELVSTVSRYLGNERTERSFLDYALSRGVDLDRTAEADIQTLRFTENLLASAIGTASSRLVMSLTLKRRYVGVSSALKLLDDASEALQYNRDLLQSALDHVRQGIAVYDRDMRLI